MPRCVFAQPSAPLADTEVKSCLVEQVMLSAVSLSAPEPSLQGSASGVAFHHSPWAGFGNE